MHFEGTIEELQELRNLLVPPPVREVPKIEIKTEYLYQPNDQHLALFSRAFNFMAQGQKISAIKAFREATRIGLKEAKEVVEGTYGAGPVPLPETFVAGTRPDGE